MQLKIPIEQICSIGDQSKCKNYFRFMIIYDKITYLINYRDHRDSFLFIPAFTAYYNIYKNSVPSLINYQA